MTAAEIRDALRDASELNDYEPTLPLIRVEHAAVAYADLLEAVELGRKVVVDRTCQTCEGEGSYEAERGDFLGYGERWIENVPCPHCTDGLVPYIALTKQGGEWSFGATDKAGSGTLDVIAELPKESGG